MPEKSSGATARRKTGGAHTVKGQKKAASAAQKRPVKKTGSRGAAASAARRRSGSRRKGARKAARGAWWAWPVTVAMLVILTGAGVFIAREMREYAAFQEMRKTVSFSGFYPGVTIEGADVTGKSMAEVLLSLREREERLKQRVSVTLSGGGKTWNVGWQDLNYLTDYEQVVRQAYQLGREGSVHQRYEAIRAVNQYGAAFTVTRGYDQDTLRRVTDGIADELSYPAVDATITGFDPVAQTVLVAEAAEGRYVDKEQLYNSVKSALDSGTGDQTVAISQQTVAPTVLKAELEGRVGLVATARTHASGTRGRRNNIARALKTLDGRMIVPGETFSFNGAVGERTAAAGYEMAGAFVDGLKTEELGGGICQVSTTLFNAVVKADLTVTARQPHSRLVGYVDPGKDAAVSWPNQDFRFTNSTDYPVFIHGYLEEESRTCVVEIYGQLLPAGQSIIVEAEVVEVLEPGEPRYNYTKELPTGQKILVEEPREGCKAVAYKVYLDAAGQEIKREVLCNSTYAASGGVYTVGQ